MATKFNIDDIKDANSHNSAMALTAAWAQLFKKYSLNETEDLTDDPGASFNVFLHLTAQGAAKAMFEQAARINEVNESTAILPKSLLNKLNSDEIQGIFGTPSETTIAFCIKKDDIIDYSIQDEEDPNNKILRINKDLEITFEGHSTFRLPYDVIINCKTIEKTMINEEGQDIESIDHNIYAIYDIPSQSGMKTIFQINTPNISSRYMRYDNNDYIAFFLKVFQISRKTVELYISDPDTSDTIINFENSLVGFEVFRESVGTAGYGLMRGITEGNLISDSNTYHYSYDYKRNAQNLNISFSKLSNFRLNVGDKLKINVYSTEGKAGNIKFPYMIYNINKLIINYNQDLSDAAQNTMLNIMALAFARDEASVNGANQKSLDQIRQSIINKKYSREILITNSEIINKAKELGLDAYKFRHDIISMYYRGVDKINYNGMTLSTGINDFNFDLSEKEELTKGSNIYLIKPTDIFGYDKNTKKFKYIPEINKKDPSKNLESWKDYVSLYNESSRVDNVTQACFPFYIQYKNSTNPTINIYDMNINQTEVMSFDEYNDNIALDKLDISFVKIYRNPYTSNDGVFDKTSSDTYYISFIVYTGLNTLNKMYQQCHSEAGKNYVNAQDIDLYNKQYVKFDITMINNLGLKYTINPLNVNITNIDTMVEDGYLAYQATFTTNNNVSENKQLYVSGIKSSSSISTDYSIFVPIESNVKINIKGTFTDKTFNPNNEYCISYNTANIQLVNYLTDYFGIDYNIQTEIPDYNKWEENVPKLYESSEYIENEWYDPAASKNTKYAYPYECELDANDNPIFISSNEGIIIPRYKYKHKSGDPILKYIDTRGNIYNQDDVSDVEIQNGKFVYIDKTKVTIPINTYTYYYKEQVESYKEFKNLTNFFEGYDFYTKDSLGNYTISDTKQPVEGKNYYIKILVDNYLPQTGLTFWDDKEYYDLVTFDAENNNHIKPVFLHKIGEYKYYIKDINNNYELVSDEDDESASQNSTYVLKTGDTKYTGILKNVSWINRLYFSGSTMYSVIREKYLSLIDNIKSIQNILFDGGQIFAGLKRTTGASNKYKAFLLDTNSYEYLSNIALSIEYRVKFKDKSSIEEKRQIIIDKTMDYINNLKDNVFAVDALFDYIKQYITDIEYINIIKINDYYNGIVQFIEQDTSVTDELLTVAQKIVTSDDGSINFEPDITVNVIS